MELDVDSYLTAVSRAVRSLERDGVPARSVALARSYATTPAELWQALTDPQRLQRWFLPVSGELRQGGRYQIEGNAGGIILACEASRHLGLTWEFGGETSWVDLALAREQGGTLLTLQHIAPLSPHWQSYGPGAVGVGWELALAGLAAHLPNPGEKVDAGTFSGPAGKRFMCGSAENWARADIANGEDPDVATAAALATASFYTGEAIR